MLANATRICEAKFANLFLYEENSFRIAAQQNAPPAYAERWRRQPVLVLDDNPHNPLTRLAATKSVVDITDLMAEPGYVERDPRFVALVEFAGARTHLLVPMLKEDELIGAIAIFRQEVRPFTDKQIELVTNFASQAVIAIENTRLLNELRESLQQQTATADVLKVISRSAFDLQTVLDTLVESAARLCEADIASINRQRGEHYWQVASYGFSPEFNAFMDTHPIPAGRGSTVGRTVPEGRTVHIHDVLADPEFAFREAAKSWRQSDHARGPALREGSPIGVIVLQRKTVQPFTDKQIELVTTFADQAVIAIENVRLFDEVQARTRELTEALEQQTATSEVLRVISSSPGELKPVFDTMLENAVRICEAKFGIMARFDGQVFHTVAMLGVPPAFAADLARGPRSPRPGTALARLCATRQTVHIGDVRAEQTYVEGDAQRRATADLGGARTLAAVPMLKENELVGAIIIYRQEVRPFTDKQIELVTNFAEPGRHRHREHPPAQRAAQRTTPRDAQQQTATADVLKVISRSTFDLQTVLDTLVESAARLCEADMASINRQRGEALPACRELRLFARIQRIHGHPSDSSGARVGRWPHCAGRPNRSYSRCAGRSGIRLSARPRRLAAFGPCSVSRCCGKDRRSALSICNARRCGPSPTSRSNWSTTFADQAVIAIENVRLFDEVQARTRELQESLEYQTAISDVLNVISRSPSQIQPVLDTIVETAQRLCHSEHAFIFRLDGGRYHLAASKDSRRRARQVPARESDRSQSRRGDRPRRDRAAHDSRRGCSGRPRIYPGQAGPSRSSARSSASRCCATMSRSASSC